MKAEDCQEIPFTIIKFKIVELGETAAQIVH
jgi:hypothetical protein